MTEEQIIQTLLAGSQAIFKIIGVYPKYLRVPYGAEQDDKVVGVAQKLGFVITTFNIDSMDYSAGSTAESIVGRYNEQLSTVFAGQGAFISVHQDLAMNSRGTSLYADQSLMAKVVRNFQNSGYKAVGLDVCTKNEAYRSNNVDYRSGITYTPKSDASTTGVLGPILSLSFAASVFNYFF